MKIEALKKKRSEAAEADSVVALNSKAVEPEGAKHQSDKVDRRKSKKTDRRATGQVGSAKGIETMFRNAYRAQLDLIALAATKANIMISLNGFIASILMVSGAFIYATEPMFLPPAIVFLVTSVISIYFALWAASPGSSPEYSKVAEHARNLLTGKTSLQKLRQDLRPAEQEFEDGVSNILVFEDLAKLPKDDYLERMQELLADHTQIYEKMSDQLYWLGIMADKKFKMLRLSYAVFGWGMIFSVFVLVIVRLSVSVVAAAEPETLASTQSGGIATFEHIYEPSGVEQLADGRLVIIEDEPERALSIASFEPDGSIKENLLIDEYIVRSSKRNLDDLEGISIDGQDYIYSITSHSRSSDGTRKQTREQLVRLKLDGNRLVENKAYTGLGNYLERVAARGGANASASNTDTINVEALSFDKEKGRLLIAFRAPLVDGKSMIAVLENPAGIFERNEMPRFSEEVILLDLEDSGIRSLVYAPQLDGYLLTSNVKDKKRTHAKVWFWNGVPGDKPTPYEIAGLSEMENAEGITPVIVDGEPKVLVVSDDGNAEKKRPARYLLLSYKQLLTDPSRSQRSPRAPSVQDTL